MSDATLGQANQVLSLIAKSTNPHSSAQWLVENFGAVQKMVASGFTQAQIEAALVHFNPYASERVEPKFFYPEGYKPNSIEEQVGRLRLRYDWLDDSHVAEIAASWPEYERADGLYVIPKPSSLAVHLGVENPWDNFGLLTEQGPISALAVHWTENGRTFRNYLNGQMTPEYYRLAGKAKSELALLEATQSGDLLVFPAQTGRLYAGCSVRNSRNQIQRAENPSQWPLPSYVVAWMLYANEHRLTAYGHLAIDCPGDEYSFDADGRFDDSLYFGFSGGRLNFGSGLIGYADGGFGSASGFSRLYLN